MCLLCGDFFQIRYNKKRKYVERQGIDGNVNTTKQTKYKPKNKTLWKFTRQKSRAMFP